MSNHIKIEIIHFMIDTSYKFMINNTDIKIRKHVLFVITSTTFQYQYVVIYVFSNVTKIL